MNFRMLESRDCFISTVIRKGRREERWITTLRKNGFDGIIRHKFETRVQHNDIIMLSLSFQL